MAIEPMRSVELRIRLVVYCLAAAIILVGVIIAEPPSHATIEVGPVGGSFYQIGQKYRAFFAARGIDLELRPKVNSLEIMRDLADPNSGSDIGFEAQDVEKYQDATVFTAGQIQLQPLFIFASADLGRRISLTDLRGRKIVMPPANSATSDAAVRMFQLYDITPDNTSFTFMQLTDAANELHAGHFDAGVFMLAPENDVVRGLTNYSGLRLVAVPEAKAIANHLSFLRPIVMPRGIYDIADGIPPADVAMLAGTVDVVVRPGLHPYVIYTLLAAMAEVHRGATFLSAAGAYPTISGPDLTVEPHAQEYYRSGLPWSYRNMPPWLASFVDRYLLVALAIFVLCEICRSSRYLADISHFVLHVGRLLRRTRKRNARLSGSSLNRSNEAR
jgi:TRAP-type uncharacterized transport system substrate-binding protein